MKMFGRWSPEKRKEGKEKQPETITAAALRFQGRILVAPTTNHIDIYPVLEKAFPGVLELTNAEAENGLGWMTSRGRFVLRKEGLEIATRSKQVDMTHVVSEKLYSSDLKAPEDTEK